MNYFNRDTDTIDGPVRSLLEILLSNPSFFLSHGIIILLFIFFLRAEITYLSISIPAVLLASYHEWTLNIRDGNSTIRYSALGLLIPWLATFLYRLAKRRTLMHNLPGMPHSIVLGHIPTMAKEAQKFPLDAHNQILMNHVADQYDLRQYGLFYMDVYPLQRDPLLVVISPEVAAQVSQIASYPKHPAMIRDFGRALGPRGMVGQEGADWKELRTMFNPGFSQANLFSMVPMMVDETEVFTSRLSALAAAGGFVKNIESLSADLTVDVIGQALFGLKFNTQTSSNAMVAGIIEASRLTRPLSDLSPERLNLWRTLKLRYYETISNRSLTKMLCVKWSELAAFPEKTAYSNAIFDIAMAKYMKKGGKLGDHVTKDFLELMRDNVKTFIFAGHDTTSSVLAYAFYELSRHPKILEEVRAEHENILGSDFTQAAKRLKEDPKLANALPLTAAVVREIMRLYLPASSARLGPEGSNLIGKDGKTYPASGFMVWLSNSITMHDPESFPFPYSFIPHRFLPDKSPFPPIPKNAYRPFERGSRDCIGQELAMLESRVVLALTVRRFDFREAYEELDRRLGRKEKVFEHCANVGGRAYQILWTTAKPKDGLPVWVTERKT